MRLLRFDILAYGHFTDHHLDFSEKQPGLHLIYGDNQAGKSTTLRAIRGLFFGIEQQSRDTFLHEGKKLRLGAELEADGEAMYVVRRKGRKDTLLDAAGAPLDETRLRQWLGGADQGLFDQLFGLDHESLRQGAHALLDGEGGAADTLFSAGAGTGSVRGLLRELRAEADELFTSKSRTKLINVQIKDVRDARQAVTAASTSASAYTRRQDELQALSVQLEELSKRRASSSSRKSVLERQLRVLPLLARRKQHRHTLAELGHVPDLPKDSEARRIDAEAKLAEATQRKAHEQVEIERVGQRLESLQLHVGLQALDPQTVDDISAELGGHRKAMRDLPKREGELKTLQSDAGALLRDLGSGVALQDAAHLRLTTAEQQRLERLSFEKAQFESKLQDAASKVVRIQRALARRKDEASGIPKGVDVSGLRLAVSRIQKQLAVEQRLEECRQRALVAHRRFTRALAALSGFGGNSAQLASLPFPTTETVREFERRWALIEQQQRDARTQLEQARAAIAELERQVTELSAVTEVPSRSRLIELRRHRDDALAALAESEPKQLAEHVERLRDRVGLSDEYADRLADAAGRVATLSGLQARKQESTETASRAEGRLGELETESRDLKEQWRQVWAAALVTPSTPREMLEWMGELRDCIKLSDQHEDLVAEVRSLEGQLVSALTDLSKQLEQVGQPPRQLWEPTLTSLVQRAESVLEEAEAAAQQRQDLERRASLERDQLDEAEHEQRQLVEREKVWRTEWHKALKTIDLPRDSGPEAVRLKLAKIGELMHKLREIEKLEGRIHGMQRDSSQLEDRVRGTLTRVLPEHAELDLVPACELLISEYRRARADHDEAVRLRQELERRSALVREVAISERAAREQLAELMASAGAKDLAELRSLEELAERARDLRQHVAELDDQIVGLGDGAALDELLQQVEGLDAESARREVDQLEDELSSLEGRLDQLRAQHSQAEQELARLDAGAAASAEELAERTAKLATSVSAYLRLRLSYALLASEVERYREANQGPLLERVNELFPRLTRDAFTGVKVDFDDKDAQVLSCLQADGAEVPIEGLSDGTLDQLYLALRLASLERYLAGRPALPLVLDDILIHFDDDRAKAALEVLGEFARGCQVLFFTHHRRMLELAQAAVPPEVLATHQLSPATANVA